MQISGTSKIRAPAAFVAELLQDPEVLTAAIPGCTKLERGTRKATFEITVEVGIGAIKGEQPATLALARKSASSLTVTLRGTGASRIEATAVVTLSISGTSTEIVYEGTISAHGAVARLGATAIEGAVSLLVRQTLRNLKTEIEARVG